MFRYFFWLFLISLVIFRYFTTRQIYQNGDKIRITSQVLSEPVNYGSYQSLSLVSLKISLPAHPEIHYGDSVVIEGVVENGKLAGAKLVHLEGGLVSTPYGFLVNFRQQLIEVYQKSLPEPHASLIAGITLGAKSSLPGDFWTALKNTGTMHVVVASGMNITFVTGFLLAFWLLFFERKIACLIALIGIWLYTIISGFQAPIIRATIMGSITFLGQEAGKVVSAWRILVITALLMLIIVPTWLFDLGFILSFVATSSLMLFQKRIEKLIKLPKILSEHFSTSLAAQIGVTPILFVTFGQFNLLSPIINMLVLPTVGPIMAIGALGGVLGIILPGLGRLVLYLVYPLTWWFVTVIRLFG